MEFDGRKLLDIAFLAKYQGKSDETAKLIKIFSKYVLSVVDGLAMLLEIATLYGGETK